MLYEHPNGAELNTAFRYNLDEMAHGEKREGDSTILSLRSIFKEGKNVTEGEAHLVEYSTEQVIQELVGDPAKPSLMTAALVMATGAKVLRDDFTEEGNKIGARAYMGVLRNAHVYFSETIDMDEDGVLVRSLWAEPESSLRHLLSELSVADEVMWERTGIQFPDPEKVDTGQAIYYPSEKLTRETMMHVIRMYQAMNT